jgi:hypothetical protein
VSEHPLDDLVLLAEGILPTRDGDRVVQHLQDCVSCRDELQAIRVALLALKQAGNFVADPILAPHRVAEQLRLRARREQSVRLWLRHTPRVVRRATAGLAFATAAVGVTVWLGLHDSNTDAALRVPVEAAASSADTALSRYLVVLWARATPLPVAVADEDRRRAYGAWRTAMTSSGRLAASGQLTGTPPILLHAQPLALADTAALHVASQRMRGFLVVRAGSPDEAVAMARLSPDIGFGGLVTVSAMR